MAFISVALVVGAIGSAIVTGAPRRRREEHEEGGEEAALVLPR